MTATMDPGDIASAIAPALSAAGETRRSLVEEGRHAFAVIVARAELTLPVAFEVELRDERIAAGRVDRLLDCCQPPRRRLREIGKELIDEGRQLGIVDALPDEAPARGVLRSQLVAKHRETHRSRSADQSRQEVRAARIGNEADLAERLQETRRLGRNHEIAGERDIG